MELIKCRLTNGSLEFISENYKELAQTPVIMTIGQFDGVHSAHQELINRVIEKSNNANNKSAVFTFFPHPAYVLQKRPSEGYITTLNKKIEILSHLGVDYLIILEFTLEVSKIHYLEFEKTILSNFKIDSIVCGYDFRYGNKGEGNYQTLKQKYKVEVVEKIELDHHKISSTKIRELLIEGKMEEVKRHLGRNFTLKGRVINGNKIGSTIGMATANLHFDEDFYPLKQGVYATKVHFSNRKSYLGVCNIGHNPSFNYVDKVSIEVHILDFHQNIYGEEIEIEFYSYLREEMKFTSPQELLNQIDKDIKKTKELIHE